MLFKSIKKGRTVTLKGWKEPNKSKKNREEWLQMNNKAIYEQAKETAKKIRRRLKKEWPELAGTHFSVKSSTFAGGDSVTVTWADYPSNKEVQEILSEYESESRVMRGVNEVDDIHGYNDPEDGKRYIGAKYISTSFTMTDEKKNRVLEEYKKIYGDREGLSEDQIPQTTRYRDLVEQLDQNNILKSEYDRKTFREHERKVVEDLYNVLPRILGETDIEHLSITNLEASLVGKVTKRGDYKVLTGVIESFLTALQQKVLVLGGEELIGTIEDIVRVSSYQKEYEDRVRSLSWLNEMVKKAVPEVIIPYRKELVDEYSKEYASLYSRLEKQSTVSESKVLKVLQKALTGKGALLEVLDFGQLDYKKEVERVMLNAEKEYIRYILAENAQGKKEEPEERKEEKTVEDSKKPKEPVKEEKSPVTKPKESTKTESILTGLNKDHAIKKVYGTKEQLANDVLTGLLKGKVHLVFIKADGSERYMAATRSIALVGDAKVKMSLVELNTETELKKEINKGTISVIDLEKNEPRAFVLERLQYYQVDGGEVVKVVREDKTVTNEELKKYFDPTKLQTGKMIEILGDNVVRIVFEKSDGSTRAMMATRSSQLVELYTKATEGIRKPSRTKDDSEEAIQRQIDKDYVTVFDLTDGEFKSYKPSRLKRYDEDLGISSWMEFAKKNDAWYDIAINGASPVQYFQEGKRGAKNIGSSLTERKRYEDVKKEYIEDSKEHRKLLDESARHAEEARKETAIKVKRRQIVKELVAKEAKKYVQQAIPKGSESLYRELVKVPDVLSNNIAFNNMENTITQVQNFDKNLLVAVQVRQDVLYLHPTFIVNAYSGRVYLDNTDGKVFGELGKVFKSDVDWGSEDVLTVVAKKMQTGGRKKGLFNLDEGTVTRINRILTLAESNKQAFSGYGLHLSKRKSPDNTTEVLVVMYKGRSFLMHPDVVIEVLEGKGKVIFKNERTTSRVVEFEEFFKGLAKEFPGEQDKKVLSQLGAMFTHGLDLRKRVKDVS